MFVVGTGWEWHEGLVPAEYVMTSHTSGSCVNIENIMMIKSVAVPKKDIVFETAGSKMTFMAMTTTA